MSAATGADYLVLSGISKRYGGVRALEKVDFNCNQGNAWKYVPKGTCETIKTPKGTGSLEPNKS
jgi:uncharacterized membrane protein